MRFLLFFVTLAAFAQAPDGRAAFQSRCSVCHGTDGNGGEHAPSVFPVLAVKNDEELGSIIRDGVPRKGMPAFKQLADAEVKSLVAHMRALGQARRGRRFQPVRVKVTLTDGSTLEGLTIARTSRELQLRTDDQKIHLLRNAGNDRYRRAVSQFDWPSMHGQLSGNRYAPLNQINTANVAGMSVKWVFAVPNGGRMQGTPQVYDGVMFVASTNTVIALDAGSGARLWEYSKPPTQGLIGNARSPGNNRSVTIAGDRVFFQTDHAHLVALNRHTGAVLWDTEMADFRQNYNATGSLLAVEDLVVAGTAGGEEGVRGFLAAYDQKTGKEVWRFWTIPAKGEPGSETWDGVDIAHGGGPTWLTGSYDPESKTVYWPTGNAGPDFNGDNRKGDNLYTCSILALDVRTGKLKWHFQPTPHDEWDWDAVQTPVLVDREFRGRPRKLMLWANRNGFFYVLDRATGEFLQGKPFVKLDWAKGLDDKGRPMRVPGKSPSPQGTVIYPGVQGGTNWFAPSYSAKTGLFYLNVWDDYWSLYFSWDQEYEQGKWYAGGGIKAPVQSTRRDRLARRDPKTGYGAVRALHPTTGAKVWEYKMTDVSEGGLLTTAANVLFTANREGNFFVLDATNGQLLWHRYLGGQAAASPVTYLVNGKQRVSMAIGHTLYTFGLRE